MASETSSTNRTGIRRARPQLSCVPCRQGKLKCNRAHPACDQCLKRSRENACAYLPPPPRIRQNQNLKGRLRHLETLVLDLMKEKSTQDATQAASTSSAESGPTPPYDQADHSSNNSPDRDFTPESEDTYLPTLGRMRIGGSEPSYVSGSHWSAILKEIKEVRNEITDFDEDDNAEPEPDGSGQPWCGSASITFGQPRYLSKKLLLDQLPEKAEADRLLAQWYNSSDPFIYAVHGPTFQKEYQHFWENPTGMPMMWYGLFFSILSVSVLGGFRATPGGRDIPVSGLQKADLYQNLAASAMALADISKPQQYAIECLLMYGESQYMRWDDAHVKIWLLMGTTVRIALRMGYHRDASHYPSLTPFQGEMRRRHWNLLYQMDVLVSFAIGLPSMIRTIESDTRAPHHLLDSDFGPDSKELPPERSLDQVSPGLYTIAKARISKIFAAAAEGSHAITTPPIAETLDLDQQLQEAQEAIAPPLKPRPLDQSLMDPPDLIMLRFNLQLLCLKTRCVLHRRYLTTEIHVSDEQVQLSRRICIESAMKSLDHMYTVFNACEPGGQLFKVRWYLSSLTTYDFLLAAMIICVELSRRQSEGCTDMEATLFPSESLVVAMERVQNVWEQAETRLREAKKAARAMKLMLSRIKINKSRTNQADGSSGSGSQYYDLNAANYASTEIGLGQAHVNYVGVAPGLENLDFGEFDEMAGLGNILDAPMDFDWSTWDNQVRGTQDTVVPTDIWTPDMDFKGLGSFDPSSDLFNGAEPPSNQYI